MGSVRIDTEKHSDSRSHLNFSTLQKNRDKANSSSYVKNLLLITVVILYLHLLTKKGDKRMVGRSIIGRSKAARQSPNFCSSSTLFLIKFIGALWEILRQLQVMAKFPASGDCGCLSLGVPPFFFDLLPGDIDAFSLPCRQCVVIDVIL